MSLYALHGPEAPSGRIPIRRRPRPSDWGRRLRRWQRRARKAWLRFAGTPLAVRLGLGLVAAVFLLAGANAAYHVIRKPTEMLFPLSGTLNKEPAETWRQYAPLFREYATATVTPELLAALAQAEAAGNPLARTYWRWRPSWNPFAIYAPASSAVGMYQMTDATFAEARRYCIQDHLVVEEGCWLNALYSRLLPSHAIELTAAHLDRGVGAILAHFPRRKASAEQKQDVAAILHLCGATPARAFVRRGFRLAAAERCGDHDTALYLGRVNAMRRQFLRLAAAER